MIKRYICSALFLMIMGTTALAGDETPDWLRKAASASLPSYGRDVKAAVLVDEASVTVKEDGLVTTTRRYAVRVLVHEGRSEAIARETYQTDSGKVRDMRAWLIKPSGEVKKYGKEKIVDVALVNNDVYNEARRKVILAYDDADTGSVFGYETVTEGRSIFSQMEWVFQVDMPVLSSRLILSLPAAWHAESITFNHAPIQPQTAGNTYTWELGDLAPIDDEPSGPPFSNLAPRVAVSYFPGANSTSFPGKTFKSWTDISVWLTALMEQQAVADDALAAKTRALCGAATGELDRIRAIGKFAQSINYVSIQMGVGRGGGYKPHAATEVFSKAYGDCKDKANLMRTMLKVAGITAYPLVIYSGDPTYVREEWVSPQQFNHCIVAVKVSDEVKSPAVITHPSLGRLLIFDPTDEFTPVGDLPGSEQGSFALLVAGDSGGLIKVPATSLEANRLERKVEAEISPSGKIDARILEQMSGQTAAEARRELAGQSKADYTRMIERWVMHGASGAAISKIEPIDSRDEGRFNLTVEFSAPQYGQLMQGKLLVFKPAVVSRHERLELMAVARKQPVVIDSEAFSETARIRIPAQFKVDELPDTVKIEQPFGFYSASCEVKDGVILFSRSLILKGTTVPAAQYQDVRTFFEKIRAAEQAPVVLLIK